VSVEGIGNASKTEGNAFEYDGVDCTLLHGGFTFATASAIELVQLKYSGAKPNQQWTLARLKASDKKKGNNSVLRRLADAYTKASADAMVIPAVRLVSNQPVSDAVIKGVASLALGNPPSKAFRDNFKTATGLPLKGLQEFASSLDVVSQTGSRFELDDQLLLQISEWTDDDARAIRDNLLTYVQKLMLPENVGRSIRRENIIAIISGVNSEESLFPCPTDITYPPNAIERQTSKDLAKRLLDGETRICLHGGAGFGKTTVLQQIDHLLPQGSQTVLFDCYGAGRYVDASRKRHSPDDAFRQISNDMATRLGLPLFLTRENGGTARTFARRLSVAADTLGKLTPSAILLIVIDAADNSLMAASQFRERSFVEDLVSIQDLPANVRLVISCRSSRKTELQLPTSWVDCPLTGFTKAETAAYVQAALPEATDAWIEDFHVLSNHIPRVQQYALTNGSKSPDGPLGLLRPSGKTLNVIFESIFEEALRKSGIATSFSRFCAALISLPRPIPLSYCATLCGIDQEIVRDLSQDLAPGLRMEGDSIAFADEDIEAFVRDRAHDQLSSVGKAAAQLLLDECENTEYAAVHVATALYHAGKKAELLELIERESDPKMIADPLRRREVQLQRIKLGALLANDMGDDPSALRALLRGAEAIKADDAILDLYRTNLDLAVDFAEESVRRKILLDKEDVERHGSLIAALMLKSAISGQSTLMRLYRRQYDSWLYQRELEATTDDFGGFKRKRQWQITAVDVANVVEAAFLIEGSEEGLNALRRWIPRRLALDVADVFVPRLLIRGRSELVKPLLEDKRLPALFRAYVATAWIRGGLALSTKTLIEILGDRRLRAFVKARRLGYGEESRKQYVFLDKFLFLCEKVVSDSGDDPAVRPILQNLCKTELRASDRLFDSDAELLTVLTRAYCLICRLDGREGTVKEFFGRGADWKAPPRGSSDDRRIEGLETVLGALIGFFSKRSELVLAKRMTEQDAAALMNTVVSQIQNYTYRIDRLYKFDYLRLLSLSVLDLICMSRVTPSAVLQIGASVLGEDEIAAGFQLVPIYARASIDPRLHDVILKWVTARDSFIRAMETTSREKIDALTALARIVLTFAPDEAKILFTHAHEATVEIDSDVRFQLKSLSTLASLAIPALDSAERKGIAARLTLLTSHAAVRLQHEDGFPWQQVARALTTLHPGAALAASARWQDSSLASLSETLPEILEQVQHPDLNSGELRLALNPLLENAAFPGFDSFRSQASQNDLCRDILQFGSLRTIRRLSKEVKAAHPSSLTVRVVERASATADPPPQTATADPTNENIDELIVGLNLTSANELQTLLHRRHESGSHIAPYTKLRLAQGRISTGNRIRFLDALVDLVESNGRGQDVIEAFEHAKSSWATPAVLAWFENQMPRLLARCLPALSYDIAWGDGPSTLDRFLALAEEGERVGRALVEGIGSGLEGFTAAAIYGLISRVYSYAPSSTLNQVIGPYSERLIADISSGQALSEEFVSDIPDHINDGLARFLTALLSDVDTRVRWRAAHAMRRIITYCPSEILPHFTALWARTEERSFRAPKAPFYWQAMRLWMIMTLSRLATDKPSRLVSQKSFLLGVFRDENFPLLAARSFARDILLLLQGATLITLSIEEQQTLDKAFEPGLPRIETKRHSSFSNSDEQGSGPRWRFDPMDVMPYWFRPATGIFADLGTKKLVAEAERWILDRWHVDPKYARGQDEPRRDRFSDRNYELRSNRGGKSPVLEDYETYLAWYGLQCAIGSLARTESLSATTYEDGQDEFDERLERQKLIEPPFWLADMLSPRPADPVLLVEPEDLSKERNAKKWFSEVTERDFLEHLFRGGIPGTQLIVAGDIAAKCSRFLWDVDIRSALVSPENSLALVRALQTAPEPLDYCLPYAGDNRSSENCALDEPAFELQGWIVSHESGEGIDENDPLNMGCSRTLYSPHPSTGGPTLGDDGTLNWPPIDGIEFHYERWKDQRDLSQRDYEGPDPKSRGARLYASAAQIESYLQKIQRDLILRVDLTREKGEKSYQRYEKEESEGLPPTEGRFTGIFLFRTDGSIFTAERCLGTWKTLSL
jgi:hypothetical protein